MKIGVMLAAVASLFGFWNSPTTTPVVQASAPATSVVSQCLTLTRSLSYGMTEPSIADLQTFLGVRTTGYFGPLTKAAVIEWQVQNGVISSAFSDGAGIVGPKTRAAMRCENAVRATNIVTTPSVIIASSTRPTSLPQSAIGGQSGAVPAQGLSSKSADGTSTCPIEPLPKPAASLCTVGEWILIHDEAGCLIEWDCSDPNAIQ